ncbi:MAG TPA: diacylglycerol kinase family protein [Gemmataceae bacterium]|nr:diacylglycerol kinase family protein [Gemmataceae bacterium]
MGASDVCVIFNPRAGRDRARRRIERLRRLLGPRADFRPTRGPGHGEELAFAAAAEGFPAVAAAGGDGTVHEVANGIVRAGRPEVVLEVYPVGSANDYAHSLGLDPEWRLRADPAVVVQAADVGVARAPDGRLRYFINNVGIGFNGAVNQEARRIRRLQGLALYGAALLRCLCFRFAHPPMTVVMDGRERRVETLSLTLSIGRREGNFVVAPDAVVDDGLFDYLHAGPLARWELFRNLPGLVTGRLPEHPRVWRGRCREVSLRADVPLLLHLDGELFEQPEREVRQLDVSILPGGLRVMARRRGTNP